MEPSRRSQPIFPPVGGFRFGITIDFEVMLTGEVVLELDDGAEVVLRPGDTFVPERDATPAGSTVRASPRSSRSSPAAPTTRLSGRL
jgi:hypothetical protein